MAFISEDRKIESYYFPWQRVTHPLPPPPHQLDLCVPNLNKNSVWSNGTYAVVAQLVKRDSDRLARWLWGRRGGGEAEDVDVWQLF